MIPPVRVTEAVPEDAGKLARLFDEYRRFYGRPADLAAAESFLRGRLERGESVILTAYSGPNPVGFVQLYPSFDSVELRKILILHDLFVETGARGHGVASELMEVARQYAESIGACGISLATAIDNHKAQALYEKLGYVRDDRFLHYFLALSGEGQGV